MCVYNGDGFLLEIIGYGEISTTGHQVVDYNLAETVFVIGECQLEVRDVSVVVLQKK